MKFRSFIPFTILIFTVVTATAQTPAPAPTEDRSNAQSTLPDRSSTRGYTLGPGDKVAGSVHGELGYDFFATIDEDGMLSVPFMKKPVPAQCRTVRDVEADIKAEVGKYLREPNFSLQLRESLSRPTVSVGGEIMKQMEITLTRNRTLIEILTVAGGLKEEASGEIQVTRPATPVCMAENDPDNWKPNSNDPKDVPSRTYSWANVQAGKADSNPTIYPGDQILIKRAAPVYINGQVVGSQGVYLKEDGLSLSRAIAMVGGPRPEANIDKIAIYRLKPGQSQDRELISANLKAIRTGKQKDVMLQPYDLVVVDKAKKSVGAMIAEIALNTARSAPTTVLNPLTYRIIY
jgi:protein involved in polysaccharide export with SLBB domain